MKVNISPEYYINAKLEKNTSFQMSMPKNYNYTAF